MDEIPRGRYIFRDGVAYRKDGSDLTKEDRAIIRKLREEIHIDKSE